MGIAYASGRYALAECQKCGLRVPYLQIVSDGEWRHLRVCSGCFDPRHPQERLKRVSDPIALWRPAPESRWPPTAPVLSGEYSGSANSLSWTAASSPDSGVAGYRLYRAVGGEAAALLADLPVLRSFIGAIEEEPLAYLDLDPAPGAYEYHVVAYDLRDLVSAESNIVTIDVGAAPDTSVSFDVTLGLIPSGFLVGYGYEVQGFIVGSPPLVGAIEPDPPVLGATTLLAIWAWETAGIELWMEGPLPTDYATLRIQADGGTVELNLNAPDEFIDNPEGQSWLYWLDSGIWQAAELGQIRRITFLE